MDHPANIVTDSPAYLVSNVELFLPVPLRQKIKASLRILYSRESRKKFHRVLETEKPDVVHLHNIYHHISPSILHACRDLRIPTVMTLHDYKILCPVYTLFTKGQVCEKCLYGKYYWCLFQKCCRDSLVKSFLSTFEMYFHHRLLNIYDLVDVFICPSLFLKTKMDKAEFKGNFVYLPNFVWMDTVETSFDVHEKFFVYFGRLSHEKGLITLLSALKGQEAKCKIIGEGPVDHLLEETIKKDRLSNVSLLPHQSWERLVKILRECLFAVVPSEWYENNPRSILEAFGEGKPVLGARIGGIPELIEENRTGLTFHPGDVSDLRAKIKSLWKDLPRTAEMGKKAREFVGARFNPETHYQELIKIYEKAIEKHC